MEEREMYVIEADTEASCFPEYRSTGGTWYKPAYASFKRARVFHRRGDAVQAIKASRGYGRPNERVVVAYLRSVVL